MSPFLLQFANGNMFFIGLGMVVVASVLRLLLKGWFVGLVLRIAYVIGVLLVLLSATPLSEWYYGVWLGLCIITGLVVFAGRTSPGTLPRKKVVAVGLISLSSLGLCLLELPYHLSPAIPVASNQPLFVIGDSISAGISPKEKAWPEVLGSISHLNVINLAKPGATVESASRQCAGITESNGLVLLEIGGNDLLGRNDSQVFLQDLDKLLAKLSDTGHHIAMFELPLFPFENAFGKAQRNLARKYNVVLIPKRCLTDVFSLQGGTLDGLHLSQKGNDALAGSVGRLLKTRSEPQ
jgi:acyl-CoA thioesterase-1